MIRKILLCLAAVLLASCSSESVSSKDSEPESSDSEFDSRHNYRLLDIVYRDFSVTHPDFDNHEDTSAQVGIGTDGYPMAVNEALPAYLQKKSNGPILNYGICKDGSHGYTNAEFDFRDAGNPSIHCDASGLWAKEVKYTPGMVKRNLVFNTYDSNQNFDMFEISPSKSNSNNANDFEHWFDDDDSLNLRSNAIMTLTYVNGWYQISHNYNDGGFSPLDSIDSDGNYCRTQIFNPSIQPYGTNKQFGPQDFSFSCSDDIHLDELTDDSTTALCKAWLDAGGSQNPDAATNVAKDFGDFGYKHLRNKGFTFLTYIKFRYIASKEQSNEKIAQFIADDDMWVFVDGVLALDLGGIHEPVPGILNLGELAINDHGCHEGEPLADQINCSGSSDEKGWADSSWHNIHIFYADRKSDDSNLLMRFYNIF